jgi:heptosyltransferase-2
MEEKRIAIIKLGALGDIVRTLPLLKGIKDKFPVSKIIWITKKESQEILEGHNLIDRIILPNSQDHNAILNETFDALYNFDVDLEATEIAKKINAKEKFGFSCSEGFPCTFNSGAEYYLNTMFDDELKKKNKRTYQQMMFDAANLKYSKQSGELFLSDQDKRYAQDFFNANKIPQKRLIGIHMGASSRWPSKAWHEENIQDFIQKAHQKGYTILLFGGPNEIEKQKILIEKLVKQDIHVFRNNPFNSIKQFSSLVNLCDFIVSADSLALHISLALKKPTIGLFFCTPPEEVEDYNLLKKLISPRLEEFFPQKMDVYDEDLTKSISAEQVLSEIENLNNNK